MNGWILAITLSFTAQHAELGSDINVTTQAVYQKPFETKAACEAAAPNEKQLLVLNTIRYAVKDAKIEARCLESAGEEL